MAQIAQGANATEYTIHLIFSEEAEQSVSTAPVSTS